MGFKVAKKPDYGLTEPEQQLVDQGQTAMASTLIQKRLRATENVAQMLINTYRRRKAGNLAN